MSRINAVSSLSSNQMRLIHRLSQVGNSISQNTERLATLKRINSAADDPAGLVSSLVLQTQLTGLQSTSNGLSRAKSILQTADSALSNVVNQLQNAKSLILEAAGGSLSDTEVSANQLELDSILKGINSISRATYGDRRLLDGSSGFGTSGVDTTKIDFVSIASKTSADDYSVAMNVTAAATQANKTYSGGTMGADATVTVTGSKGSAVVTLHNGYTVSDIAEAFNGVNYLTGVNATVNSGNVVFKSDSYGSAGSVQIQATSGTFNLAGGGSTTGTDAVATINGQSITAKGTTFKYSSAEVDFEVTTDPSVTGAISTFKITGEGLNFLMSPDPSSANRIGLPNLDTAHLGGGAGLVSSLGTGGANDLASGNYSTALSVVDEALDQVMMASARLGGFEKYVVETAQDLMANQATDTQEALGAITDTDIAVETAALTNNQLLQQTTLEALAITNMQQQGVLQLLRQAASVFL
ncbi:MAG: flagellin [Planctomycetales bacterium]